MIPLNLICNIAMFWKSWTLTFWPHLLGSWRDEGEGSAGKIVATMLLHFVIPFNLICNMTLFWPFDPKGQGEGSADKIFATMLMHSLFPLIWYATWPFSEKVEFWPVDPIPRVGGGSAGIIWLWLLSVLRRWFCCCWFNADCCSNCGIL